MKWYEVVDKLIIVWITHRPPIQVFKNRERRQELSCSWANIIIPSMLRDG